MTTVTNWGYNSNTFTSNGSFTINLGGPATVFVIAACAIQNGTGAATVTVNGTQLTLGVQDASFSTAIYGGTVVLGSDPQTVAIAGAASGSDFAVVFWTVSGASVPTTPTHTASVHGTTLSTINVTAGDIVFGIENSNATWSPTPTNSYHSLTYTNSTVATAAYYAIAATGTLSASTNVFNFISLASWTPTALAVAGTYSAGDRLIVMRQPDWF